MSCLLENSQTTLLMLEQEGFEQPGKGVITTLCAWCGRIKKSEGDWEITPAIEIDSNTTHGICPECMASEMCAARQN